MPALYTSRMTFVQRQELRQGQTLVMTPQLQQAIKLLQFSHGELMDYIETELEKNPLLEAAGAEPDERFDDGESSPLSAEGSLERAFEAHGSELQGESPLGALGHIAGGHGSFNGESDFEDTATSAIDLREHLQSQLNIDIAAPEQRMIGAALIDQMDEAGYLPADLSDVALSLGCSMTALEVVLRTMQRFDPVGIMARSLKECLAVQLREKDRLDPAMEVLLENLHLIAERNLKALATRCGVDTDEVIDMITEIKTLNPKPALAYDHSPDGHIIPDVQMRPNGAGGWIIELNPDALPRLLVSRQYSTEVLAHARAKDREYLSERLAAANWLVKALDQRANTILKVSAEIVRHQSAFFTHGVTRLRPLVLREVAAEIGMHESTVSRVTANKFILTPRGTFELKYFFSSAISGTFGDSTYSGEAIRARIKALTDREDPADILSDDTLVEKLHEAGIDIARRTVAKYREQMNIASSVQRRREKAFR